MIVRAATPADLPAILDIYNHAVLTSTATAEYEPNTLDMRIAWYESHLRDNLPILVADQNDGRIVGWSSLSKFHPRYGYRYTVEDSVYVAALSRGQGVARRLLVPLIDAARELGMHSVIASIDAENEASIRLHQSLGFAQTGYLGEAAHRQLARHAPALCARCATVLP